MVILNFLAAPRAARTGRARDLGEQENWGEAFLKTDTYANLALERSWYELFGIIKAHGPKIQPPSSPRVSLV